MLARLDLRGRGDRLTASLPRPAAADNPPTEAVRRIIAQVRQGGDQALRELTARFDKVDIDEIRVPPAALKEALEAIDPALRSALEEAAANVEAFHRSQHLSDSRWESRGVVVREQMVPVD